MALACQSAKPQLKPHAGGLEFGLQIENPPTATLLVEDKDAINLVHVKSNKDSQECMIKVKAGQICHMTIDLISVFLKIV